MRVSRRQRATRALRSRQHQAEPRGPFQVNSELLNGPRGNATFGNPAVYRFVKKTLISLGVVLMLAGLASPTASARSAKAIWGPVAMPDGSSAFPVYRGLGVRVFQAQLEWNQVAASRPARPTDPNDPAYTWPKEVDAAVREGRRYGIRVALMVKSSPGWANGGRAPQWAPNNSDYAHFLTAASRRYRSVRHWLVWGEANRAAVFRPLPKNSPVGPRRYATLLNAAYHALKRRSRRNIVIGGMTFSFGPVLPRDFLRWMRLPNGKPPPLDWYGHNPFSQRFPDIRQTGFGGFPGARDISDIDTFALEIRRTYKSRYRAFRRRGPRLWLSEYTISSDRVNRDFDFFVSRAEQARFLSAAYRIARREPYIAGLGWIGLLDDPVTRPDGITFGLMTYEGERKPAYFAYKRAR